MVRGSCLCGDVEFEPRRRPPMGLDITPQLDANEENVFHSAQSRTEQLFHSDCDG